MEASPKCDFQPCLQGSYIVVFIGDMANGKSHVWRLLNLVENECSCKNWQDQAFPCIHSVAAAIRHGKSVKTLFNWSQRTERAYQLMYNYQWVPIPLTHMIMRDEDLRMSNMIVVEERVGKHGQKPGPKPKHRRKTAKVGSAATPNTLMF